MHTYIHIPKLHSFNLIFLVVRPLCQEEEVETNWQEEERRLQEEEERRRQEEEERRRQEEEERRRQEEEEEERRQREKSKRKQKQPGIILCIHCVRKFKLILCFLPHAAKLKAKRTRSNGPVAPFSKSLCFGDKIQD